MTPWSDLSQVHWRMVASHDQEDFVILVTEKVDDWLSSTPSYERLDAELSFELRPVPVRKSLSVPWAKQQIPQGSAARILALGDDFTDEDTFRALGVHDDAVLVGHSDDPERSSFAHWYGTQRSVHVRGKILPAS